MKVLLPTCLFLSLMPFMAEADIIYFKDGMRTICQEKAWEENGEIKCEYGGWVISYEKNEVERILKTIPQKQATKPKNKPKPQPSAGKGNKTTALSKSKTTGTAFYDPRRPFKYWTSNDSKHNSYKEAIRALANQYQRTTEWIQAHMGDTNDLDRIHRNLADPDLEQKVATAKPVVVRPSGPAFYNPRRPFPYWSWENSKHKSYKDAIQALAQKYQRSPEWIQTHMGTSNNLTVIHQNLKSQSKTK